MIWHVDEIPPQEGQPTFISIAWNKASSSKGYISHIYDILLIIRWTTKESFPVKCYLKIRKLWIPRYFSVTAYIKKPIRISLKACWWEIKISLIWNVVFKNPFINECPYSNNLKYYSFNGFSKQRLKLKIFKLQAFTNLASYHKYYDRFHMRARTKNYPQ